MTLPAELEREWLARGARWVGDLAIITSPGQNRADFRRRIYAALGLTLREVRL